MRSGIAGRSDGPLFDIVEGRDRRDVGMLAAQERSPEDWKAAFTAEATRQVSAGLEITSEDVIAVVGMPPSGSPSAVGALINALARRGVIEWTGRVKQAERPTCHAAILKLWRAP